MAADDLQNRFYLHSGAVATMHTGIPLIRDAISEVEPRITVSCAGSVSCVCVCLRAQVWWLGCTYVFCVLATTIITNVGESQSVLIKKRRGQAVAFPDEGAQVRNATHAQHTQHTQRAPRAEP